MLTEYHWRARQREQSEIGKFRIPTKSIYNFARIIMQIG